MLAFSDLFSDNQAVIALIILLVSFLIQLFYYLGFYLKFVLYTKNEVPVSKEPVSVIICARNEADNLETYLPLILEQDYPDFEVIVVNDCSTDNTEDVLKNLAKKYSRLRTTTIREDKKFSHGKKIAVTLGIKAAKNDRLVFIDGDCKPESNKWLSSMASHFSETTSIVLGYGGYFTQPGFLNRYIRYDTMMIALQYMSFALWKIPYMGVGRNLAYKKSLFYAGNGFSRHFHLASGDDDLFVNENATAINTEIEFSPESHTRTAPKESFDKWFFQKKRHFTTNRMYKATHKLLLGLEPVSRLLFYAGLIYLLIVPGYWLWVLMLFVLRLAIQLIVIKKTMARLNEKNLLLISLLFDLMSLFINFGLLVTSRTRPSNYQWK
ncbi:MAG TPA: glycosyltransferase [Bacteroidales bacterium]|nr:glycosyltransferase [Bacteroidales bacterium]